MVGQLQWFFGQRVGWIAVLGGIGHSIMFLVFVAFVEHWGRDLRMEPVGAWAFLTVLSCVACFAVAYGAHQWAKFDTDRPWFDRAQTAEKQAEELKDQLRDLREAKRRLTDANESLFRAHADIRVAMETMGQTLQVHADRVAFLEPRNRAAEDWLDAHGQRVVSNGAGFAEVQAKQP